MFEIFHCLLLQVLNKEMFHPQTLLKTSQTNFQHLPQISPKPSEILEPLKNHSKAQSFLKVSFFWGLSYSFSQATAADGGCREPHPTLLDPYFS